MSYAVPISGTAPFRSVIASRMDQRLCGTRDEHAAQGFRAEAARATPILHSVLNSAGRVRLPVYRRFALREAMTVLEREQDDVLPGRLTPVAPPVTVAPDTLQRCPFLPRARAG